MPRAAGLTVCLCLWAFSTPVYGQQTPAASEPAQAPVATPAPAAQVPAAPAADEQKPPAAEEPDPVQINPRTGLPLTADELRQREIDKFDPMKRQVNPLVPGLDSEPQADPGTPAGTPTQNRRTEPLPGSIAATNAARAPLSRSGGSVAEDSSGDPASAESGGEYTGPAVLSRSYTLARPLDSRVIKWQAFVGINYGWNSGQAPGSVKGVTTYESTSSQSASLVGGLSGRHIWKRDQVGFTYSSGYSAYGKGSLSGGNSTVTLDYSHVVSRRISFNFVESFQELSQNYSLENPALQPGSSIANINLATSPNVQLLNSRIIQSSSQASMTFRQSSRLSYNVSSSYFVVSRTEGAGTTGNQFSGDVNYRLSRRTTAGAYYSFTQYLYPKDVLNTSTHGFGLIYSFAFNSRMQLQTRLGVARIENLGFQSVPLPPLLAALLGQGSVVINAYSLRRTSDISAQLVRDFGRNRTASLAYVHGQSPGNGVLLTSIQESISANYSTSLMKRRLPLNASLAYSRLSSTSQTAIGTYRSETISVGTSRQLARGVGSSLQVSYGRYNVSGTPLSEHSLRISLGFNWSPPIGSLLRF